MYIYVYIICLSSPLEEYKPPELAVFQLKSALESHLPIKSVVKEHFCGGTKSVERTLNESFKKGTNTVFLKVH